MDNKDNKFNEYKQKIIDLYNNKPVIEKLKNNQDLNRNFQFQIYLLLSLNNNDEDLNEIMNNLKNENVLIHFFNDTLADDEIVLLLENNHLKISKSLEDRIELTINDLIKNSEDNKSLLKSKELQKTYVDAFINSKKKKWYKKIQSKAITTAMFLAFATKTRDKKFKLLLDETIDNLNREYGLDINKDSPDREFLKVFYEYVINSSIKKSLIIVLIVLVVIFIIVLTTILVLTS